jgi:hypothetical protein
LIGVSCLIDRPESPPGTVKIFIIADHGNNQPVGDDGPGIEYFGSINDHAFVKAISGREMKVKDRNG